MMNIWLIWKPLHPFHFFACLFAPSRFWQNTLCYSSWVRSPPGPLMLLCTKQSHRSVKHENTLPTKESANHWREEGKKKRKKKKVEPAVREQRLIRTMNANWMRNPLQVWSSHKNKNKEQGHRESQHLLRAAVDGSMWPSVQIRTLFMDHFCGVVFYIYIYIGML